MSERVRGLTILLPAMSLLIGLPVSSVAHAGLAPTISTADEYLANRGEDARVAQIAYRLATVGGTFCPTRVSVTGMVLHRLSQYQPSDRPEVVRAYALDQGAGVVAVVPGSPAAAAGVLAGDLIVEIDGHRLPTDADLAAPFDVIRARAGSDALYDLLVPDPSGRIVLSIRRAGTTRVLSIVPTPACLSRVHLARSAQRNAFADGSHVFITTAIVARTASDDELAFVIAHEMAHNILGHAVTMRGPDVRKGIGRTFGRSGRIVRTAERAADRLGGQLMLAAGYDPVAGVAILDRLGGSFGLMSAYDTNRTRTDAMRIFVGKTAAP